MLLLYLGQLYLGIVKRNASSYKIKQAGIFKERFETVPCLLLRTLVLKLS